jgi:adenylate cyclase
MTEERISRIRHLLREARRRRVYTAAAAYIALSLVLIQLGHAIFDALLLPQGSQRLLTVLLLLGFPVVLVLAWIFDVTPEGVRRTEKADRPEPASDSRAATAVAVSGPVSRVRAVGARPPAPARPAPEPEPEPDAPPPDPARVRHAALAHVRHELRTPVNAILGYSEMLLEDATEAGEADAAADLRRIREAGGELLALIDAILDPARAGGGGEAELAGYAAQIRADLRNPINAVVGYSEMLLEAGPAGMAADLERIRGAAAQLLELSSDIVGVATGVHEAGASGAMPDASALAEGVLRRIRPVTPGSPFAADRTGSLLIVDDNALNRDVLARQLARMGYFVATAADGREALERLGSDEFDLVLLDIIMPGIDGVQALRRIRTDPRLADLPVIMISALDEVDGAIRCIELGADDYLTKPFHPVLLDARIGTALELRRSRHAAAAGADTDSLHALAMATCPPSVLERMQAGTSRMLESYAAMTVLCCDAERAARGERSDIGERVARIDAVCGALEAAAMAHGSATLLLHGAVVTLVTGTAEPDEQHVERAAAIALDALAAVQRALGSATPVRLGMHTAAGFGALVGGERRSFHLWGEAVELARALEAHAEPGTIHISPAVHARLRDRFRFTSRGVVDVSGRGQMRTWCLAGPLQVPAGG